jgi:nucleotide-binding universal stress UspA family protein
MSGTILCGVTDTDDGRAAAQMATALSERLGLRLVFAHVIDLPRGSEDSVTGRQRQEGATRAVNALLREISPQAEYRIVLGRVADRLAQIAAEEGADLIVLGSRKYGLRGRKLRCLTARELEAATPAPVVVAPPQTRRRSEHRLEAIETMEAEAAM